MTKFIIVTVAAVILAQTAFSAASDKPTASRAKPASFVPHPHTNTHVYGSPIQPALVGHSNAAHRKRAPKARAPSSAHRSPR
jgi:hypothetical protein